MWTHIPGFVANSHEIFELFLKQIVPLTRKGSGSRYSCVFVSDNVKNIIYEELPTYNFSENRILSNFKQTLETTMNTQFDYCLFHLYLDGSSGISYHNDKEALNTMIVSVSLGATRKFRFRRIGQTSGWIDEILLNNGDLIIMHPTCQRYYQHSIPKELTIKEPRINLTFRKLE